MPGWSFLASSFVFFVGNDDDDDEIERPTAFSSRLVVHTLCLDHLYCTYKLFSSHCTLVQDLTCRLRCTSHHYLPRSSKIASFVVAKKVVSKKVVHTFCLGQWWCTHFAWPNYTAVHLNWVLCAVLYLVAPAWPQ
jgi:hypothetical protein